MMQVLIAGGADPKLTMPNGATALMLAAGAGSPANEDRRGINVIDFGKVEPESKVLPAVRAAWGVNGDVTAADNKGNTALHAAVTHRYATVVQFLADHGADVNARNKDDLTPLGLLGTPQRTVEKPTSATSAGAASPGTEPAAEPASERIAALLRQFGATR